jgi:taurine dioxygenase
MLSDDALVTFSKNFGQLDLAPTGQGGSPFGLSRPEIAIISNIIIDGNKAGSLGNSELVWHQDMSYVAKPPKASILYGINIPKDSGDTSFYNLYEAYTSLPSDLKKRIAGLSCRHDATRNSAGVLRAGFNESYSNEKRPGAIHPLVIRHPQTGRHALYLGRRPNAWIVGLTSDESDKLLNKLWSHITNPSFIWTQK